MRLYFLEYKEDAQFFLEKLFHPSDEKDKIICLSPDPVLLLEKAKLDFSYPENILPKEKLANLATASWPHAENFCNKIDEEMKKEFPDLNSGVPYIRSLCDNIRILFDSCRMRILQLKAILETYCPAEIHYFATTHVNFGSRLLWDDSESLNSHLIPLVTGAWSPGSALICYPQQGVDRGRFTKRVKSIIRPKLSNLRVASSIFLREDILREKYRGKMSQIYCKMQGNEGFIQWLLYEFRKHGRMVFYWNPSVFYHTVPLGGRINRLIRLVTAYREWKRWRKHMGNLLTKMELGYWFKEFFMLDKVDYYPIVASRLRYLATVLIPHAIVITREGRKLLPHINGLIGSYFNHFSYLVAIVASQNGKKVLTAQHGPEGFIEGGTGWPSMPHTLYYHSDKEMATHALRWGEGIKRQMEQFGETRICAPIVVGARQFEHLKYIIPNNERCRVLYAMSAFPKNEYDFTIGSLSANDRYLVARRIIDALSVKKGVVEVWVKTHPSPSCSSKAIIDYIQEKKYQVRIITKGFFIDLLKEIDAVVLDSLTSPLAESIPTKLLLFIFTGTFRATEEGKRLLNKRAYFHEDIDMFCKLLSDFVEHPDFYPAKLNNEFEKTYILPSDIDTNKALQI